MHARTGVSSPCFPIDGDYPLLFQRFPRVSFDAERQDRSWKLGCLRENTKDVHSPVGACVLFSACMPSINAGKKTPTLERAGMKPALHRFPALGLQAAIRNLGEGFTPSRNGRESAFAMARA